jgi:hypothetical protein
MAKELFESKNFQQKSLDLIQIVNGILDQYAAQGFTLSLRQLYYQLVARGYIENSIQSYKRVGTIVSDARLAGLIDWDMIEDRARETVIPAAWDTPGDIIKQAARQFRVNRWEGQTNYVEVMVEKDALSGILRPVCHDLHVRFTANKGYSSSSAMYEAGKRIAAARLEGKTPYIFYLGDHDPSGIDMTRDITERLQVFSLDRISKKHIDRLALNMDQVRQWNPPENPAKDKDTRYDAYVVKFGASSWELDAVEPVTLAGLVRDAVNSLIDRRQWDKIAKQEKAMRAELETFANNYQE